MCVCVCVPRSVDVMHRGVDLRVCGEFQSVSA